MSSRASPTPSATGVHITPVISRTVKHSIFNQPRRRFSIPLTPEDPEMHNAVRNAIRRHKVRMQREKEKADNTEERNSGEEDPPKKSAAEVVFDNRIQAMENQLQIEKEALRRAEGAVVDAQNHLIDEIKRRDELIKKAKAEVETEVSSLRSLKEEYAKLHEQLKQKKAEIKTLESEEEAKRNQLREERKRKAQEILMKDKQERELKRVKVEESSETSNVQRLEKELDEKRKELNQLEQIRTDLVWLMKQVILAEMKNKKKGSVSRDSTVTTHK